MVVVELVVVEVLVLLVVEVVVLVVELVVVEVEVVGVELVVVVTPHAGRLGSVQEQFPALQSFTSDFLHLARSPSLKPAHAAAIPSEQTCGLHSRVAAAGETKTPTPSATAANNVTTAFRVIAGPRGRSHATIDFGALPPCSPRPTRLSTGETDGAQANGWFFAFAVSSGAVRARMLAPWVPTQFVRLESCEVTVASVACVLVELAGR